MLLLLTFFSFFSTRGEDNDAKMKAGRRIAFAALLCVCFLAQAYSLSVLHEKKNVTLGMEKQLLEMPETIVVTDLWWLPQEMGPVFYEKTFFCVKDNATLSKLLAGMRRKGTKRFLLVTQVEKGKKPDRVLRSDLKFFDVAIYRYTVK
jgi:hypothetical protein